MIKVEYQDYVKAISIHMLQERIFTDTLRRLSYGTLLDTGDA